MLTKENVEKIGSKLRQLIKEESLYGPNGIDRGCLHVCSVVMIDAPLVAGFWVLRIGKENIWVELRGYEVCRMPEVIEKIGKGNMESRSRLIVKGRVERGG
ncbi:hypothetical protein GOBAR_DD05844 [Gossypium barbadense]|nr:hypothetical protein GOBAR_DD05844 [Gossypium barbadense]